MTTQILNWTGNPWVDTGLSVMMAKSGKAKIEDFTKEDLDVIVSDGEWLADINRQLKAFTMVFGTNSPLTNPSSNQSLKKKPEAKNLAPHNDVGFKDYCSLIKELKDSIISYNNDDDFMCESCGEHPSTNILANHGKKIGRDWFPLIGSIGSDAQILPAASRTARICALCLLSVQFLPLGAIVIGGKFACFQSNYNIIIQNFVNNIFNKTKQKLELNSKEKLSAIGKDKGTKESMVKLIDVMTDLQKKKRLDNLPDAAFLNIWLFSNSGQNPDCEIIEIPNEALKFLWDAAKSYESEIKGILNNEKPKRPEDALLGCVSKGLDYNGLYPYGKMKPVSKDLFKLYQEKLLKHSAYALELTEYLVCQIKSRLSQGSDNDKKLLKDLIKENSNEKTRPKLRRIVANLAEEGLISLEEYTVVFPKKETHHLSIETIAFKWIWFYLNQETLTENKPIGGDNKLFTNPKIQLFAKDVFDYYSKEKGVNYVKKNIIDGFKRNKIGVYELEKWFLNFAEKKEKNGYTLKDWDDFCRDENGNNMTHELLFQFRLEMANLYRVNH
ncbi:MAG: Cas8a1 family CRISPR/Cas system-associated protein [bacterium]|jgi:hypothetical protein